MSNFAIMINSDKNKNEQAIPFTVIAGPCSAESRNQTVETALELAESDAIDMYRAGLWKPRTRPGCFEGTGAVAIEWMLEAREKSGLPIATEVATPEHVMALADAHFDLLWVGARTSADPFAMQALADALGKYLPDTPVFVKNPVSPDLELWIGAIQRLKCSGVKNIGAIHRGFSVYKSAPYRNAPIWQIPLELHRRLPGLQIIHDPSHTGGAREHLPSLSQKAIDMGFTGLMIESHPSPQTALSDGGQQLTPSALIELLNSLKLRDSSPANHHRLDELRDKIDVLDSQLLSLLAQRLEVCSEIGEYKRRHNMPVVQPERYDRLLTDLINQGEALGLDSDFLRHLLEMLHAESVRKQLAIIN